MERKLTCIICPRGCRLTVSGEGDSLTVTGHACPRGETYAINECTNPVRTITSIVRVENREDTMVSVKTAAPVPKDRIFEIMGLIRSTTVTAPVKIGDVIIDNVYGTQVVATKNID